MTFPDAAEKDPNLLCKVHVHDNGRTCQESRKRGTKDKAGIASRSNYPLANTCTPHMDRSRRL